MLKWLMCLLLWAITPAFGDVVASPSGVSVGTVQLVDGPVTVRTADGPVRTLHAGDAVREGDTIATGSDGEVHLQMADRAYIALRGDSQLKISGYRANGDENDASALDLIRGAMRSITGWIGRHNRQNYALRTPTATIGIRGTDHETLVLPTESNLAEPGTYEHVLEGEVSLHNLKGETAVRSGQAAFAPQAMGKLPALLPHVPTFFPKGKHESQLDGLHAAIQQTLDKARAEKRKLKSEKAEQGEKAEKSEKAEATEKGETVNTKVKRTKKP